MLLARPLLAAMEKRMSLETTNTVAATVNTAELDLVLRDYLEVTQR